MLRLHCQFFHRIQTPLNEWTFIRVWYRTKSKYICFSSSVPFFFIPVAIDNNDDVIDDIMVKINWKIWVSTILSALARYARDGSCHKQKSNKEVTNITWMQ